MQFEQNLIFLFHWNTETREVKKHFFIAKFAIRVEKGKHKQTGSFLYLFNSLILFIYAISSRQNLN